MTDKTSIRLAVCVVASVLFAPPAGATTSEYLNYLDVHGVAYPSVGVAIAAGISACVDMRARTPLAVIADRLYDRGFGGEAAFHVTYAAAGGLCPDTRKHYENQVVGIRQSLISATEER